MIAAKWGNQMDNTAAFQNISKKGILINNYSTGDNNS
jgi:hypothetical protein